MKGLVKTLALVKTLLGIKKIPIEEGKSNFSEEQKQKLLDELGEKTMKNIIKAIDQEATAVLESKEENEELEAVQRELAAALKDTNMSEEEAIEALAKEQKDGTKDINLSTQVRTLTTQLIDHLKKQDKMIEKLINEPEGDSPESSGKIKQENVVKHSKTHLFGSNKAYDALDSRPWNQHAAIGQTDKRTNWMSASGVEVQKLNEDLDMYYRENPEAIRSLHRDNFGLPSFWPKRTKVVDEISSASIVSAEISQARKLPWLPKNKQAIKAETGKIFPIQIDINFVGKYLQDLEASWLSKFVGGGSQPYKMSFVQFLVSELDKKARQEDRKASINGIYVPTPDDSKIPGRALNRQDGLLILLFRAYYIDKKFKATSVGVPTKSNILDYINDMIEKNVPEEIKNDTELVLYWSKDWERAYRKRYRQVHGMEVDFDGNTLKVELFPNIRFVALPDLAKSNFMFITTPNNIEILENIPAEKSLYTFEKHRRLIDVLADYKMGIRMIHIGNKVKEGDPDAFKVQTVWTNGLPMFSDDVFVPLFDDTTGEIKIGYSNITVVDEWKTDITEIKGQYPGQVIKVRGNTNAKGKIKTDAGADTDFDLSTGGTITFYVKSDGDLKELSRTTEPPTNPSSKVEFDGDVIDADEGSEQYFTNETTDKTVTEIIGGFEGQEIVIHGNATKTVTISDVADNISVDSTAALDGDGKTLTLVKLDGIWKEVSRNV